MKRYEKLESLGGSWTPLRDFDMSIYIIMIESSLEGVSIPLNMLNRIASVRLLGRQRIKPNNIFKIQLEDKENQQLRGVTCYTREEVMSMIRKINDVNIEGLIVCAYQITKDCIIGTHENFTYRCILNPVKINYTDKRVWLK